MHVHEISTGIKMRCIHFVCLFMLFSLSRFFVLSLLFPLVLLQFCVFYTTHVLFCSDYGRFFLLPFFFLKWVQERTKRNEKKKQNENTESKHRTIGIWKAIQYTGSDKNERKNAMWKYRKHKRDTRKGQQQKTRTSKSKQNFFIRKYTHSRGCSYSSGIQTHRTNADSSREILNFICHSNNWRESEQMAFSLLFLSPKNISRVHSIKVMLRIFFFVFSK